MKRLAQVDNDLYSYDKWEKTRDSYRNGRRTAYFYDKASGKDFEKTIYANSKEELKNTPCFCPFLRAGSRRSQQGNERVL